MANDELYTPKWIFDALGVEFDLDVCAPKDGPLHTPTKRWFSQEDDGLANEWIGRVWMNPPYSKPAPWIDKWLNHGNGFALVPFSKSEWFRKLWNSSSMGVFAQTNTKFVKPDGKEMQIFMPTALWAIGSQNIMVLNQAKLGRLR